MTEREYYLSITKTPEQRKMLDAITEKIARGFLLVSLAEADTPVETVAGVITAFRSACTRLSAIDAAKISKEITDVAIERSIYERIKK